MEYSRELIDRIVQLVLERMKEAESSGNAGSGRVLALFFGGMGGANEARAALHALCERGHSVSAMFSSNAEAINGADWLKAEAPKVQVLDRDVSVSPKAVLQNADVVLIPVLTYNSASKLALGIADNPVLTTAMFALMGGKTVIAAEDACKTAQNTPYAAVLQNNRNSLENVGLRFVPAASLFDAANACFEPISTSAPRGQQVFDGRLLCAGDVRGWTGSILSVSKDTVVTPAASDIAAQKGIQILVRDR